MSAEKSTPRYRAQLRIIRRYARGFDAGDGYDARKVSSWGAGRKAAVTRYYKEIQRLTSQPHYDYRPRKKSNLKAAKQALDITGVPKLKAAIIPSTSRFNPKTQQFESIKPKISVSKKGLTTVKIGRVSRTLLPFSAFGITRSDVATDPAAAFATILEATNFKLYGMLTGDYTLTAGDGSTRMLAPDMVARIAQYLVNKYGDFVKWMNGLVGFKFDKLSDIRKYKKSEKDYKAARREYTTRIYELKNKIRKIEDHISKINRARRVSGKNKATLKRNLTIAIGEYLEQPDASLQVAEQMEAYRKQLAAGQKLHERAKDFLEMVERDKIRKAEKEIKKLIINRSL